MTKTELLKKQRDEHGYNFCERCKRSDIFKLEEHHIVFKSEKPKHPELENPRNKILLCSGLDENKCHEYYHNDKKRRAHLVEERNLTELFGESILR